VPVTESAVESTRPEPTTTKIPVPTEPSTTRIRVAKEPPTTRIPVAKESPTRKIPTVPSAPYGPGSAQAAPDGGGPAGWLVKGHSETRLYYTPDDPTVPQVWFKDEESAARAGFTPWRKRSKKG
jgi:uncharacterized membrane protein ArfC